MSDKRYIFLGDSITEWGPWDSMLHPHYIVNLGIAGNKVNQIYDRALSHDLACDKLFLLAGVNNLGDAESIEKVIGDYQRLTELIISKLEKSKLTLISVLPIDEDEWINPNFNNKKIKELNSEIRNFAKEQGLNYMDLYKDFVNYSDFKQLYSDGLHLSNKGYELYSKELLKLL